MLHGRQQRAGLVFAATDALLAAAAFEAAYRLRAALPLQEFHLEPSVKTLTFCAALAAVVGLGRILGIYARLYAADSRQALGATFRQMFAATLALLTILYLLHFEVPVSRLFLAFFVGGLTGALALARTLAGGTGGLLRRTFGTLTNCVVVGDSPKALEVAAEIEAAERHGLRLQAVVDCGQALGREARLARPHPVQPLEALPRLLEELVVDEIVFVVAGARLPTLEDTFLLCDEHGVTMRIAADFLPYAQRRIAFERFGDRPLLTFSMAPADEIQLALKRILDAACAGLALAALALPMAFVALLVRSTSRGPVLFRQQRCGLNGRLFTCYKFRSMVADAESQRQGLEHLNEKDGPVFKISDDPRVTPVGRWLRRFSIDEWPQLWNVLRGEMSFVGPRPAPPSEVAQYEIWQRRRLRMRPGLTCLWAIRGRDSVDFENWMKMDLEYIDNWSLPLDLKILALTAPLVATGRGAS